MMIDCQKWIPRITHISNFERESGARTRDYRQMEMSGGLLEQRKLAPLLNLEYNQSFSANEIMNYSGPVLIILSYP